ncbi:hypothetical protein [Micromonospora marina]|uniref:hypothetical protein n=1 Tax=Micromonospora marina TaxID=307120 RepID=UPI0034550AF4
MTARPERGARALDRLDERIDHLPHQPARPAWDCRACYQPWPCPPAQVQLAEAYAGDRPGLSIYMASLYAAALNELTSVPAGLLYTQFVSWTRAVTPSRRPAAPDGRQLNKEIHRAVHASQPV